MEVGFGDSDVGLMLGVGTMDEEELTTIFRVFAAVGLVKTRAISIFAKNKALRSIFRHEVHCMLNFQKHCKRGHSLKWPFV